MKFDFRPYIIHTQRVIFTPVGMRAGSFNKGAARIFFLISLLFFPFPSFAAAKKDAYIAGKVYDQPQAQPLKGVIVRIVNLDTGEAYQAKTDKDGCYSFMKIPEASYSLSVSYNNQDYLLAEKIKVQKVEGNDVVVASCVALADKNTLVQLQTCHVCSKGIPAWVILVPAGGTAVGVLTAILITDEPSASPSRP